MRERWDIEQCFDYLKNAINIGSSRKRTNYELSPWTFINHISLLYFYGIIKALRSAELNGEYFPEDILTICKNIYKVRNYIDASDFRIYEVSEKDQILLSKTGVNLPFNLLYLSIQLYIRNFLVFYDI